MHVSHRVSQQREKGVALILSMIFLVVFSAFAVSMATLSSTNLQVANNFTKANRARACAESGMDIMRYWMNKVTIPGTTPESERFATIASSLQAAMTAEEVTNLSAQHATNHIYIPMVTLDSSSNTRFFAVLFPVNSTKMSMYVLGYCESVLRTIKVDYLFGERASNVFDFGVATRGPLDLQGNIELTGVNISVESNAYIESMNDPLALSIIGNSQIGGDVDIANPIAYVDIQGGQSAIGGETGQDGVDNHVEFGVPVAEFPQPDTTYFEPYATNVFDPDTTDTSSDVQLENLRIPANTNPHFSAHADLKGVIFIETPNVVTFTGSVNLTGVIVGDGDWTDDSGTNQINITGNVDGYSVSELPQTSEFTGLHDDIGTFIMAPGFAISIGGSFSTLSGAIAGNGIEFFGDAGGTIQGSIINYSDETMTLSGNSDLFFNRSGLDDVPAGFVPEIIMDYDATSYSEPMIQSLDLET
jgi:hypothetical protein